MYKKLAQYHKEDIYPMHMPGHKRNASLMSGKEGQVVSLAPACQMDITEIDGFDNLGAPEGILKDALDRAARLYGADATYFLVNGSTVGLLAGIMGCTDKGDKVLVARNCHKAVYNAMYLNELRPVYLYPTFNQLLGFYETMEPDKIEEALISHPDIRLVIITSPTYEGIVSNIMKIADIVHKHGAILLVDEAHGAHLGFHPYFPKSALAYGADVVIQSLHKTMPAFTQTALLHSKGNRIPRERIEKYLHMLQTSSPSYVLMASMEHCISLMEDKGQTLFEEYANNLKATRERLKSLKNLTFYEGPEIEGVSMDPSKLVIGTEKTSISARELHEMLLHTYKIQLEMSSKDYGIAMTSIGDTLEGFDRLCEALKEIDDTIMHQDNTIELGKLYEWQPEMAINSIYEAANLSQENILLKQAEGRVSGGYVYQYPPGIPVLAPGERITKDILSVLMEYTSAGYEIVGLGQNAVGEKTIQVTKQ